MSEPGSRSKQVSTFMLPGDEAAFDEALAPAIVDLGQWETHDQRARTITLHDSLPAAMRHDRTQAFLRLFGRDGGTVGPLVQYLHTSVVTTDEAVLAATGGRYRATAERPEAMSPGRLAFKWFPDDGTGLGRQRRRGRSIARVSSCTTTRCARGSARAATFLTSPARADPVGPRPSEQTMWHGYRVQHGATGA